MHRRRSALDLTLVLGGVLVVMLTLGAVLSIPLHIPIDYNEGWNATFDTRAVMPGTGPLYPGPDTFVFNNYPPLGFVIVGAAGRFLFGDMIVAGRVIATLALLLTAGLVGLAVRALGASRRAGAAAALLMLLITATFYRSYVAMDDPQWLAHATMLAGLAIVLRHGPIGWRRIVAAAGIVVAGGFIKHNLVALPLAMTVWLLWRNPRTGLVWILASAAWLASGLALLRLGYGHAAFSDIFAHHRTFHARLLLKAAQHLLALLPAAIVCVVVLRRRKRDDGVVLVALFATFALVTGVLQRLGEGVSYNAHFETLIAVCIGFGVALDRMIAGAGRPGPVLACLFAAAPAIGALPWHLPIAWNDIAARHAREAAYRPVIARLAAAGGPVGCEMMSLCYWAGRSSGIDLFNLNESVLTGASPAPFAAALARHDFALIEDRPASFIHADAVRRLGFDPIETALMHEYETVAAGPDGRILLAPRPRP